MRYAATCSGPRQTMVVFIGFIGVGGWGLGDENGNARGIHAAALGVAYGVGGRGEHADPSGRAVGLVAGDFPANGEVPLAVRADDVGV